MAFCVVCNMVFSVSCHYPCFLFYSSLLSLSIFLLSQFSLCLFKTILFPLPCEILLSPINTLFLNFVIIYMVAHIAKAQNLVITYKGKYTIHVFLYQCYLTQENNHQSHRATNPAAYNSYLSIKYTNTRVAKILWAEPAIFFGSYLGPFNDME